MSGRTLLSVLVLGLVPLAGAPPPWLELALSRLPEPASAWTSTCTLEIERNGQRSVESFDPHATPAARWTLVTRQGVPPTPGELAAYRQSRADPASTPAPTSLTAGQIDLNSLELVRESSTHATLTGGFTEEAAATDKLLARLTVTLLVRKEPAAVVYYRLDLRQPFSPLIGVRMHELEAGAEFGPDGAIRRSWSRFRGRVFLRAVQERVTATFATTPDTGTAGNRN